MYKIELILKHNKATVIIRCEVDTATLRKLRKLHGSDNVTLLIDEI